MNEDVGMSSHFVGLDLKFLVRSERVFPTVQKPLKSKQRLTGPCTDMSDHLKMRIHSNYLHL